MMNYHNSFVRYEFIVTGDPFLADDNYTGLLPAKVTPVRVRKEMLNGNLTICRVTEVNFPKSESSLLSSAELDGWGSCSMSEQWIEQTRESLLKAGFIKTAATGAPYLALDWLGIKTHQRDIDNMQHGIMPELPAECMPDEEDLTVAVA